MVYGTAVSIELVVVSGVCIFVGTVNNGIGVLI